MVAEIRAVHAEDHGAYGARAFMPSWPPAGQEKVYYLSPGNGSRGALADARPAAEASRPPSGQILLIL
jgi:hypothetical protein